MAVVTSTNEEAVSDGYNGSETTLEDTRSAIGHCAGDQANAAGCRGMGTG